LYSFENAHGGRNALLKSSVTFPGLRRSSGGETKRKRHGGRVSSGRLVGEDELQPSFVEERRRLDR
jgi:hypothetical protein